MPDKVQHTHTNENQDSIEVYENGKGEFSFRIKRYYDAKVDKTDDVIKKIKITHTKLTKAFPNK